MNKQLFDAAVNAIICAGREGFKEGYREGNTEWDHGDEIIDEYWNQSETKAALLKLIDDLSKGG